MPAFYNAGIFKHHCINDKTAELKTLACSTFTTCPQFSITYNLDVLT
jgi:hypothetical protein